MKRVLSINNTSSKRVFGTLAVGSTGFMWSMAVAAATSALLYSGTLKNYKSFRWAQSLVSLVGLSTVTSSTTTSSTTTSTTTVTTQANTTTSTGLKPMKLGVNLNAANYYDNTRRFMNLLASNWTLRLSWQQGYKYVEMPASYLDANKNLAKLGDGEYGVLIMGIPTKAYRGVSVDVVCRWQGQGTVQLFGEPAQNVKMSAQSLTFTFVPKGFANIHFWITSTDQSNPMRAIDCREADADPSATFDPTFLEEVKRYSTIRFVKWQRAVEANTPVTWATRTKAGDGILDGNDGVAIEYMVQLANETQTNPWFNIPWNADDDYVRRFAQYVRDNLDPNLKAYIETSNEVWNWMYPVTTQARDEGKAEGLSPGDDNLAMLYRYAEKTGQVMDIWSSVFTGQMSRIVRVVATQSVLPWSTGGVLAFRNTASKVDALATAPYLHISLNAGQISTSTDLDNFFDTTLPTAINDAMSAAKQQKALADQYNLRYVTYEGGQHIVSPNDVPQLVKIQRDPRMGKIYTQYLTRWYSEIGDLMILFMDTSPVTSYGGWGQREDTGQPLSEAPQANAVELFRQSYIN